MTFRTEYEADWIPAPTSKIFQGVCELSEIVFNDLKSHAIEGQILANHKYLLAQRVKDSLPSGSEYYYYKLIPAIYRGGPNSGDITLTLLADHKSLYLPTTNWKQDWYLLHYETAVALLFNR